MAVSFKIQFRINATTRVIRLTDESSGFTYGKGCFYISFPDGSTRNLPDFSSPDLTQAGDYADFPCVTDANNNVITGTYIITYAVTDNTSTLQPSFQREFNFNWIEPSNGITNLSDVIIPEVVFSDITSYSPIGSFSGTLVRTLSSSFPSTSEVAANAPVTETVASIINVVSGANYYEGDYAPTSDVSIEYTHITNSWLKILYTRIFSKSFSIKKCPNQTQLITKINTYRAVIDGYKETNDTRFNILSEQYDLVIALYSHLITRYERGFQDGSESILRELLSILEPYTGAYSYQLTKMLPFELAPTVNSSFNISDGTNIDNVILGATLTFSSGNAALTPIITNNTVTYTPTFGTTSGTFASGNDSRFHTPVTLGTANGLSLASQAISLALATSGTSGAMSAADKSKLDGIASGATANVGTVTSVGISMPSAFSVANSPITGAGVIAITALGTSAQYVTGAGALATLNTTNVVEASNLYHTDLRVRTAISLTTTGSSGAATYDNTTGVLNIPSYLGGVTSFNTRTGAIVLSNTDVLTAIGYTPYSAANPAGYISANQTITLSGAVTGNGTTSISTTLANSIVGIVNLSATGTPSSTTYLRGDNTWATIAGGGGTWGSITGTLSNQTDLQSALNAKQGIVTLTTTGTSGAATFSGNVLNIPNYAGASGTLRSVQNFVATANQTTFTISGGYTVGQLDVFLNGVRLTAVDYTASNGTTVVLAEGVLAGDIIDVLSYVGLTGYITASTKSWFDYVLGKTGATETTVSGGVVQELSYSGTAVKKYRFIGSPYDSATDIIYSTYSGGVLSNPVAYKLITI